VHGKGDAGRTLVDPEDVGTLEREVVKVAKLEGAAEVRLIRAAHRPNAGCSAEAKYVVAMGVDCCVVDFKKALLFEFRSWLHSSYESTVYDDGRTDWERTDTGCSFSNEDAEGVHESWRPGGLLGELKPVCPIRLAAPGFEKVQTAHSAIIVSLPSEAVEKGQSV